MGIRSKQDSAFVRDRIVSAAGSVFASNGYRSSSLADIAKKAGVTRGAIYWHFNDKLEIYEAFKTQSFFPLIQRLIANLESRLLGGDVALMAIEGLYVDLLDFLSVPSDARHFFEILILRSEACLQFEKERIDVESSLRVFKAFLNEIYREWITSYGVEVDLSSNDLAVDSYLFMQALIYNIILTPLSQPCDVNLRDSISNHIKLRSVLVKSTRDLAG